MPLLEIKDIFYSVKEKEILSGISLALESGEIHAILGKNGTGKSTLAYLIIGCEGYIPDKGGVFFEGTMINDLKIHERARLGMTMAWQEPVRFEGISVRDYLTLKNSSDPSPFLKMAGLSPSRYLDRMVDRSLSGGERKRIELASIAALYPRLAILDEPDSGIDMLSIQDIMDIIGVLKKNGAAVLLITHREEIARIADRASQICHGKIVCSGDPLRVAEYFKSLKCDICRREECA